MTNPKCPENCGHAMPPNLLLSDRGISVYECKKCLHRWLIDERTAPEGERVDEEYPSQAAKDNAAVDAMAVAMKAKLKLKRDEGYYGWDDPEQCPMDRLAKLLVEHVPKGDVVDIANFCMMIFCRAGYGGGHGDLLEAARASHTAAPLEAVRLATIEEAAKVADEYGRLTTVQTAGAQIARDIRALSSHKEAK